MLAKTLINTVVSCVKGFCPTAGQIARNRLVDGILCCDGKEGCMMAFGFHHELDIGFLSATKKCK